LDGAPHALEVLVGAAHYFEVLLLAHELHIVLYHLASDRDDADEPIERLVATRRSIGRSLESHEIEAIVKLLRPDADFEWDANARANITRQRLGDLCDAQISSLVSLTENRRVIARGGAGTGKTRLAVQWARKVWGEGDNVLLTCFNDPLASSLVEQFEIELDEYVHIGPFMRLALELPGMPHLEVPPNADRNWSYQSSLARGRSEV
jgi:hypothetical protein